MPIASNRRSLPASALTTPAASPPTHKGEMRMDRQLIRDRLEATVGGAAAFASTFANRTFRDLNERARRELDGGAEMAVEAIGRAKAALEKEGLQDLGAFNEAEFINRFVRAWAAYQHAGSRTANWMITGPARFPVRRNEKAMN